MKYRKKPVEVEATQWFPGMDHPGVGFDYEYGPYVVTIHLQNTPIAPGDYIVAEPDGVHYYPVKPDIFEANHIPVVQYKHPNPHIGSSLDDFLKEEGIFEQCHEAALKELAKLGKKYPSDVEQEQRVEQPGRIYLSAEDQARLLSILENPPPLSERLKLAQQYHKQLIKEPEEE